MREPSAVRTVRTSRSRPTVPGRLMATRPARRGSGVRPRVLDRDSPSDVEREVATVDHAVAPTDLASPPADTEGGRELLQRRLALLARVILGIGFLVQAIILWTLFFAEHETNTRPWHAIGQLLVLVVVGVSLWRTRAGARGTIELAAHDVILTFLPTVFWCVARWDAPAVARPWMTLTLSATNILLLRSVLVPSTGRRTFSMGAVFVVIVAGWTYAFRIWHVLPGQDPAFVETVTIAAMCFVGVVIATIASHTIYGLRNAVRRALQLGQYTLVRKIGEGGMGVVWEAKHALLRRRTAIKLLPADRAGADAIARFEREVQLTSTLTHPNTIAIYDYGRSSDGVFYYAMEYLDGIDLQALVDHDGQQSPGIVAHVLGQLCDALAEAHAVGLIHRDIKPANVLLCERGGIPLVAKVLDFGLVKSIDASSIDSHLSAANVIVGTPLYMAPEVVTSPDRIDARSDLYAVGAVGYFLLTGKPIFDGGNALEVFAMHLHGAVVPPSERLEQPVPGDLEALLLACLEKNPDMRPASAAELSARLAATEARRSFSATDAKEAWERCRALAGDASAKPQQPTRLTVQLRARVN